MAEERESKRSIVAPEHLVCGSASDAPSGRTDRSSSVQSATPHRLQKNELSEQTALRAVGCSLRFSPRPRINAPFRSSRKAGGILQVKFKKQTDCPEGATAM